MQISSKDFIFLIGLTSVIFLIAPVSLVIYINLYNNRKRKHREEKDLLKKTFEHELLKSQMEVQEQTRQTIASNLHDNIGQLLSLTIVTLSSVNTGDPVKTTEKIASAEELAKRCMKELRQLSRLIHGQELIRMGLSEAIAFELNYLNNCGLYSITFNSNYVAKFDQPDREIILFRIFQELLNNVIRHSSATAIEVTIRQNAEFLELTVKDNGKGFEQTLKEQKGMGLFNIRKRVQVISAELNLQSYPGLGTEVIITVPYQPYGNPNNRYNR